MKEQEPKPPFRADCHCGCCRFVISASPIQVSYCHCADCRKAIGAPVSVFVGFRADAVESVSETPAVRQSSTHAERLFCSHCGTPVAYRDKRLDDELYFYLGVMDDPACFEPTLHAWAAEAVPWLCLADHLPRHEGFSRSR